MTAMRPTRRVAEGSGSELSGVEQYAPRRAPQRLGSIDQAAAAFEGEIREFVRRDVTYLRRTQVETDSNAEPVANRLNSLIHSVSGTSMNEIDRVIVELQGVRDMLRNEGDRVAREIAGYASLSHAAITSMRIIADSLTQWKSAPERYETR